MTLRSRFESLLKLYTSDTNLINEFWAVLIKNYSQKFRAYHNTGHLKELFNYFDVYKERLEHPSEVTLAIFYHDIIYSIWKKDNEEQSAVLAGEHLHRLQVSALSAEGLALDEASIERIKTHILATKTHKAVHEDTKWMVDFDLAVLGQTPDEYLAYAKNIRKEYRKIPLVLYRPGRKKVLAHFLAKQHIYATREFQNTYEEQARENLSRELASIQIN